MIVIKLPPHCFFLKVSDMVVKALDQNINLEKKYPPKTNQPIIQPKNVSV